MVSKQTRKSKAPQAVAVFATPQVKGETVFTQVAKGTTIKATFTALPKGLHGFHIHKAGDLRGDGCKKACDHWNKGPAQPHGGPPPHRNRHTGDLGNVELPSGDPSISYHYFLKGVTIGELLGRSVIVHADEDDLGLGDHEDSKTTGHSGARIACAVIGRASC